MEKQFETELCELFYKYKSDKCPQLQHDYSPLYYAMFADQRNSVEKVLEIGIGTVEVMDHLVGGNYNTGASLRAWRDFFPNAIICGCDISEAAIFEDTRIRCFLADQGSAKSLRQLVFDINREVGPADFDLIIDDGSHLPAHMILSAVTLWQYVAVGGYYVIEDIDRVHYMDIFQHLNLDNSERNYFKGDDGWDFLSFKKTGEIKLDAERMPGYGDAFNSGFYVNYLHGLKFLCERHVKSGTRVLELGSFNGVSSKLFASHSNCLTVVDISITRPLKKIIDKYGLQFHEQDSLSFLETINQGDYDLIYIDTTHEFAQTKKEIELAWSKLNPGGCIAGHDYLAEGVNRAIHDVFQFPKIEIYLDSSWLIKI